MTEPQAPLRFSIVTLFPELLQPFTKEALLGKALTRGLIDIQLIQMRDFAANKHHKVDDTPYGGGAGMVIRVDVVERALASLPPADEVVMLTPAGKPFSQEMARDWSEKRHLVFLCGRYEGFDARTEGLVTSEVSLGDFVMMGGEAAAACLLEATARLVPNVLGDAESHEMDSFAGTQKLLDYPEYTRPAEWRGQKVPEVLMGGNHGAIQKWRAEQALLRTKERRPDLLSAPEQPEETQ